MNLAFQITEEDVANVLASNPIAAGAREDRTIEQMAGELLTALDLDQVESAALYGDDIEQQTDYAHDEIKRQLQASGVLDADAPVAQGDSPRPAR